MHITNYFTANPEFLSSWNGLSAGYSFSLRVPLFEIKSAPSTFRHMAFGLYNILESLHKVHCVPNYHADDIKVWRTKIKMGLCITKQSQLAQTQSEQSQLPRPALYSGYYVQLDYEPPALENLVQQFGGTLQRRGRNDLAVYFDQDDKGACAFTEALKQANVYFNPAIPAPEGLVRCQYCRTFINPDKCLHHHDRGINTYECLGTDCKKGPPIIIIVKKYIQDGLPPFAELSLINLDRLTCYSLLKYSKQNFYTYGDLLYKHDKNIFLYKNCECDCLNKWRKLSHSDAGRIRYELMNDKERAAIPCILE